MSIADVDGAPLVAAIWDLLDTVVDPCHVLSGHDISILDLGLVNTVDVHARTAFVSITLTEMSCTFGWRIIEQIQSIAAEVDAIDAIEVGIVPFPVWTPDRMSDRGRALHAMKRRAFINSRAASASKEDQG